MKSEDYWAYKAFMRDDVTERALASSEIFMAYREAELKKEAELKEISAQEEVKAKQEVLDAFEAMQNKVDANSDLKAYLKKVKAHLDTNLEARAKTDQNFVNALNLLNLE